MDIHIHIDDRLVAAVRRVLGGRRGAVLVGAGVLVATGALYATTKDGLPPFAAKQKIVAADVNKKFEVLYDGLAKLEQKQADDVVKLSAPKGCPSGMVPVGDGCVDKYEASIWARKDASPVGCKELQLSVGAGTWSTEYIRYGEASDDYDAKFPDSGNVNKPAYACAIKGVVPSRYMTWFQAQQACVFSGKHLITNGEWQAAVAGTYDPGSNDGADGACNTSSSGARATGLGASKCISSHDVEDGIGNLTEWVDMWGQAGKSESSFSQQALPWPAEFGDGKDETYNLNGAAGSGELSNSTEFFSKGMPAAANRGGYFANGSGAGAYYFSAYAGPATLYTGLGFRCAAARGP